MAAKKKAAKKKAKKKAAVAKKKAKAKAKKAAKKKAKKKAAAAKKKVKKKAARARQPEDDVAVEPPAPEPPAAEAEVPVPQEAEVASAPAANAGGLARGRSRRLAGASTDQGRRSRRPRAESTERRVIPPLPDEDDEYVPPPRRQRTSRRRGRRDRKPEPAAAPSGDAARLLDLVRRGEEHISALNDLSDDEVYALARSAGLKPRAKERRSETIYRLLNESGGTKSQEPVMVEGLLELHPDGYGFLRRSERSYSQHPQDVYVSAGTVRRLGLKPGLWVTGSAHRPRPNQPLLALQNVEEVNHEAPERLKDLVEFDKLTVVYPDTRIVLETEPEDIEMRVMDLFCPLGRGQRGLIVAPPRTGKTIMLTKIADAVATNSPEVDIVVLLVDERPEEVTNMKRSVRGEVVASTFDKPASNHIRVAELVMEKVKRMVEYGRHVVLLLDSITRLGRAYNNQTGGSGRILSGGLDAKALTKPKRFFGSARNVEDGGSLTIVATALVDTGSKMDTVIFEEFKGTGNMELVLSRDMANARVWPAIDVPSSGTRNEDLLMHPDELRRVTLLRRGITGQDPQSVMLALRKQMEANPTNAQFLMGLGN